MRAAISPEHCQCHNLVPRVFFRERTLGTRLDSVIYSLETVICELADKNYKILHSPAKQDPNQNKGNKVTADKATFLAIPRAQLSTTRSIALIYIQRVLKQNKQELFTT